MTLLISYLVIQTIVLFLEPWWDTWALKTGFYDAVADWFHDEWEREVEPSEDGWRW